MNNDNGSRPSVTWNNQAPRKVLGTEKPIEPDNFEKVMFWMKALIKGRSSGCGVLV